MTETKSRDNPSYKVSPNTKVAGSDTEIVSYVKLDSYPYNAILSIKRDVFESLPKFYRAVAEVAIDSGKLVILE